MYTIDSIIQVLPVKKTSLYCSNVVIQRLEYDSRRLGKGEESLFFALQAARDGHLFIPDAYEQGVRNFVLSDLGFETSGYKGCNFIWVEDTLQALQVLAAHHRKQSQATVIAITGSNGKTIVKEWLYQMLSADHNCYQSPKSYNSQLGVALSLWEIRDEHELVLIEAGVSQKGEMQRLENMIRPDIGVFTSLGTAHSEGFSSKEEKLSEKWKLFQHASAIVAPSEVIRSSTVNNKIFCWGENDVDDLQIVSLNAERFHSTLELRYRGSQYAFQIPFVDRASVDNVLTCMSTLLTLGYSMAVIQERISTLQPLEMRLQLKRGKNNCSILDDSYSNDLASLRIALDFLHQQNQHQHKTIVLTDFVGAEWNDKMKVKLLDLLSSVHFHRIILIGPTLSQLAGLLTTNVSIFEDTDDLIKALPGLNFDNETVLVKGARKFGLEKIRKSVSRKEPRYLAGNKPKSDRV